MFEIFTQQARRVVFLALAEAGTMEAKFIETEHLLLGLLREDLQLADFIPGATHASIESLRAQLGGHAEPQKGIPDSVSLPLPLSQEAKRVLTYSDDEARRFGHNYIGTEHLLVGLLRDENCRAAKILKELGVTLLTAQENVVRAQGKYYPPDLHR